MDNICMFVRKMRLENDLTQEEMASLLECCQGTISLIENGYLGDLSYFKRLYIEWAIGMNLIMTKSEEALKKYGSLIDMDTK